MRIKTKDLIGAPLNWAAAKVANPLYSDETLVDMLTGGYDGIGNYHEPFDPSNDWDQGGPILDAIPGLQMKKWLESCPESKCEVHIHNDDGDWIEFGPTLLIAGMRCWVACKLGDEVEIPASLAPKSDDAEATQEGSSEQPRPLSPRARQ